MCTRKSFPVMIRMEYVREIFYECLENNRIFLVTSLRLEVRFEKRLNFNNSNVFLFTPSRLRRAWTELRYFLLQVIYIHRFG